MAETTDEKTEKSGESAPAPETPKETTKKVSPAKKGGKVLKTYWAERANQIIDRPKLNADGKEIGRLKPLSFQKHILQTEDPDIQEFIENLAIFGEGKKIFLVPENSVAETLEAAASTVQYSTGSQSTKSRTDIRQPQF